MVPLASQGAADRGVRPLEGLHRRLAGHVLGRLRRQGRVLLGEQPVRQREAGERGVGVEPGDAPLPAGDGRREVGHLAHRGERLLERLVGDPQPEYAHRADGLDDRRLDHVRLLDGVEHRRVGEDAPHERLQAESAAPVDARQVAQCGRVGRRRDELVPELGDQERRVAGVREDDVHHLAMTEGAGLAEHRLLPVVPARAVEVADRCVGVLVVDLPARGGARRLADVGLGVVRPGRRHR